MTRASSPPRGLTASDPFPADCARRFEHRKRLGVGGFGSVFLAVHRDLGHEVAIKLLHTDLATEPGQAERFSDEARITASLSHPHIVRVLDHGAADGTPWMALELIRGRNLRDVIEGGGPPLAEALAATSQVAQALDAAHALGILHRDVKPENVLESAPGHYKITDFGIARWTRDRAVKTATGVILGTPSYIAPELVLGETVGPASDVYALGVMLHELLTGAVPYVHENPGRILEMHVSSAIPRPTDRKPDLPRQADAIVARALAKRPRDRFASAAEMAAALDQLRGQLASGAELPRGPEPVGIRSERSLRPGATRPLGPDSAPSSPGATRVAVPAARRGSVALIAGGVALCVLAALALRVTRPAPQPVPAVAVIRSSGAPQLAEGCSPELLEALRRLSSVCSQACSSMQRIYDEPAPDPRNLADYVRRAEAVAATVRPVHDVLGPLIKKHGSSAQILYAEPKLLEVIHRLAFGLDRLKSVSFFHPDIPVARPLREVAGLLAADLRQPGQSAMEPVRLELMPHLEAMARAPYGLKESVVEQAHRAGLRALDEAVARRAGGPLAVEACMQAMWCSRLIYTGYEAAGDRGPGVKAVDRKRSVLREEARRDTDRLIELIAVLETKLPAFQLHEPVEFGNDWTLFGANPVTASVIRAARHVLEDEELPLERRRTAARIVLSAAHGFGTRINFWFETYYSEDASFAGLAVALAKLRQRPDAALSVADQATLDAMLQRAVISDRLAALRKLPRETDADEQALRAKAAEALALISPHEPDSDWARAISADLRQLLAPPLDARPAISAALR